MSCFLDLFFKRVKSTVMQIEKALISDWFRVLKVSHFISIAFQKYRIPTIYKFAVIYSRNLLFLEKWPSF